MRNGRSLWCLLGLVLLLWARPVEAQQTLEQCKHTAPSPAAGTPGQDITVGVAATTVIAPNTSYCGALITNTSQIDAIRCRQTGTDPDGATGFLVLPYQVFSLNQDAQLGLRCIRATGATADVVVTVYVYTP